jgi:glycerol kinase
METYLIALDQGTTSSRAIVFDRAGAIVSQGQYPLPQHYPHPGWWSTIPWTSSAPS